CAIQERGLASPGNSGERVAAIIREPSTDARVHEGAGGVALSADGAVVAEGHISQGQASGLTPGILGRGADRPAQARADELGIDTVPPVAAAPADLIVLEEAIGDRGRSDIEQAAAEGVADVAVSPGAGVVRAAESPVARDGASGQAEGGPVGI